MKKSLLFLFAGALVLASSCRRDGNPSWDTGLVLPIAHTSMTIDDLIPDSLLSTNSDGSVKIVYSTHFPGLATDTLLNIPDTTVKNSFNIPAGNFPATGGTALVSNSIQQISFPITNAQIVFGVLNEGKMVVELKNDIRRKVVLRYQIPSAIKNSIPFDTSFTVDPAPDSLHGFTAIAIINLAGYTIDFTGTNHDRSNTIETIFDASIAVGETPTTIYPPDTVGANCTFTGIKPYYLRGYFGNQTVQVGPTENAFSFFSKVRSGALGLDSLTMSLDIDNYIGMDARMTVNRIYSRNANTGVTVNLVNPQLIGHTINVNRAQYASTWPDVIPSSYHFQLDNGNSNAKALIENMPHFFGYDATLITNPLGNQNSGNNDFLYAAHGIDATLNVEMPLNFFASQLVIADTMTPNFASVKNRENVLDGILTLHADNSFPFAASFQIYLLDAFDNVLDSIVSLPNQINAGQIAWNNGYFSSIGFNHSEITFPLNAARTVTLFNSTKIIIQATFETNSTPVYAKIFSTNQLNLQLNADFDYRVN